MRDAMCVWAFETRHNCPYGRHYTCVTHTRNIESSHDNGTRLFVPLYLSTNYCNYTLNGILVVRKRTVQNYFFCTPPMHPPPSRRLTGLRQSSEIWPYGPGDVLKYFYDDDHELRNYLILA